MFDDHRPPPIVGGTNMPGVPDHVFTMPPGMAIRYDKPADDLADCITGYHVYASDGQVKDEQTDWFLPGTANIRIAIDAGPIGVSIGRRHFDPVPEVSLYGPTSQALRATTRGGILIGFGISALGWGRLTRRHASDYRNRITPLNELVGEAFARDLQATLRGSDRGPQVATLLDGFLRERLGPVGREEGAIRALMDLIAKDSAHDIVTAAALIGVPTHSLRRLAIRHFGFPPKMLLNRARFLRSLLRFLASGEAADYSTIDPSYFDASHFLRDATTFLGMTPRRFMSLSTPFLDASLKARAAVLGSPTQALHDIASLPMRCKRAVSS